MYLEFVRVLAEDHYEQSEEWDHEFKEFVAVKIKRFESLSIGTGGASCVPYCTREGLAIYL